MAIIYQDLPLPQKKRCGRVVVVVEALWFLWAID